MEEAVQNHNKTLDALLERCWTNRVKLNAQKSGYVRPSSATYNGRKDVNVVSHNQPIMNKPFNCAPK